MAKKEWPFESRRIGGVSEEELVSQSAREMAEQRIDALVACAGQQLGLSEPQQAFLLDYGVLVLRSRLNYFSRVVDEELETRIGRKDNLGPEYGFATDDLVAFALVLSERTGNAEEVRRWMQRLRELAADCLVVA